MYRKTARSFTLIEMLIVIVIIGILAAALVPRLQDVQYRARDTKRKADLQQLNSAMIIYFTDYGSYPAPTNKDYACIGWVQYCVTPSNRHGTQTGWIASLSPNYMTTLPVDPINTNAGTDARTGPWTTGSRVYGYTVNGSSRSHFSLMARLENASDPDRCELKGGLIQDNRGGTALDCTNMAVSNGWMSPTQAKYMYVLGSQ